MTFDVILTVIKQDGTCGGGYKVGDEALISFKNDEIKGKICLHSLYSILPKVLSMAYGAEYPWLEDPDVNTHACPDASNPVVYEVRRLRNE